MLISVGGMEVAGLWQLPKFFKLAMAMRKQAQAAHGNFAVDLFRRKRTFFVVSVWHAPADMRAFAHSGAHGELMKSGSSTIKSSVNIHYQSDTLPTRDGAVTQWRALRDAQQDVQKA